MQNRGRGGMAIAMGNLVLSIVGTGSGGRGYVCREFPWKEDGGAGMMGKGGGGTDDETQGGGGGSQNQGRGGMAMAMGNLVLSIVRSGGGRRGYVCCKLPQRRWRSGNNKQGRRRNGQ
jgi:hypothetical protein